MNESKKERVLHRVIFIAVCLVKNITDGPQNLSLEKRKCCQQATWVKEMGGTGLDPTSRYT